METFCRIVKFISESMAPEMQKTWSCSQLLGVGCYLAKVTNKCFLNIRNSLLDVKALCLVDQNIMTCDMYKIKTGHISFNKKVKNKYAEPPPPTTSLEDNGSKFQKVRENKKT